MGLDRNKHLGLYEKTGQLCRKRHRAESSSAQEKIAFNDEVFLSSVMHPHVCVRVHTHTYMLLYSTNWQAAETCFLACLVPMLFCFVLFGGVMGQRNIHIDYLKDNVKKLKDHLRKVWKRLKGKHTSAHMFSWTISPLTLCHGSRGHGSLGVVSELEPRPGASAALTRASQTHQGPQAPVPTRRAAVVWLARHIRSRRGGSWYRLKPTAAGTLFLTFDLARINTERVDGIKISLNLLPSLSYR